MNSLEFYHNMSVAFDGDAEAQENEAKRLICGFFRWESFPDFLGVETSVEGGDGDVMEVGIFIYHK